MHALLEEPLHASMHHPNGAVHRFDEDAVKEMVLEWQGDQRPELLNEILLRSEPIANGFHGTMKRIGETMAGVFSAAGDRMPATGWLNTQASAEMGSMDRLGCSGITKTLSQLSRGR